MNLFSKSTNKLLSFFVKHRMRSTRGLIGLVIFLLFFTQPAIAPGSAFEIICDWLGYVFIVLAFAGRVFSSVFICGRKNAELSTQGLFALVRNPLYVFSFFGTIGVGLLSGHIVIFFMLIGIFFLYYPEVVSQEETFLLKKFGESYKKYCQEVPRWWPRQWVLDLPETVIVYPRLLLQTIMDAYLFFLIYPLVELIEWLHEAHIVPTLFSLY